MDEWVLDRERVGYVRVVCVEDGVAIEGYGGKVTLRDGDALALCDWLLRHRTLLRDRAYNSYDCRECGLCHHSTVRVCPLLVRSEQG
jgi:hypothetical protein